jgi:endonuclease-3
VAKRHSPRTTRAILEALGAQHPEADTELHFSTAFELLVATILSAQSTDQRVNLVTPTLFARYPDARALAAADPGDVEPIIVQTGFFRQKAKAIVGMARVLVAQHAGEVPASMDQLIELPGVGRKTANVVLGHALGVPGLPVDRHVLRVSNRIGIAEGDDPEIVEQQLTAVLPPDRWTRSSDTLILHGRRICRPRPLCPSCVVRGDCRYYHDVVAPEADRGQAGKATSPKAKASPRSPTRTKKAAIDAPAAVAPRRGRRRHPR